MKIPRQKLVFLLLCLAAIVRFVHFPERIDFSLDSSTSLIESGTILTERRFTLLGPPVTSRSINGQYFYISPVYTYLLAGLQIISFDPVTLTAVFSLFNIGAGLVLWKVVLEKYTARCAHLCFLLYAVDPLMVRLSHTVWNASFSSSLIILSWKLFPNYPLLMGGLAGLGVGFHYAYLAPTALFALLLILKRKSLVPYIAGFLIGELPLILFDLRHAMFNTRNFLTYVQQVLTGGGNASLTEIDFLWAWAFFPIVASLVIMRIRAFTCAGALATTFVLIMLLWMPFLFYQSESPGMPKGWTIHSLKQAAEIIAQDSKGAFEVASLITGDTRNYPLRYYLQFLYQITPMGVEQYPSSRHTYVIAESKQQVLTSTVWELTSGGPFAFEKTWQLPGNFSLFALRYGNASNCTAKDC